MGKPGGNTWLGVPRRRREGTTLAASRPGRRPWLLSWISAFGVLLIVAIIAGTAVMIDQFRKRAFSDVQHEFKNTALLLSHYVDQKFQELQIVEDSIAERVREKPVSSDVALRAELSGADARRMLHDGIMALPHVEEMAIVGADGSLINSSRPDAPAAIDEADARYLRELASDPALTRSIGHPQFNSADGTWSVVLARRLAGPDGKFLGAVVGRISLSHFENYFALISNRADSSYAVLRTDGMLLVRYPRIPWTIGELFPASRAALTDGNEGISHIVGRMDGKARLLIAHRLLDLPLILTVGADEDAILAIWRLQTKLSILAACLFALVVAMVVFLQVRQRSQEYKRAERIVAEQKRQLDIAINNMSQGLLLFDADTRIVLCNRRYISLYGLSPDVVKPGCTLRELIVHRQALGTFRGDIDRYCASILHDVSQGLVRELCIETPDRRIIKIVNQPVAGGGWVVTHEDITERQRAETESARNRQFLDLIIEAVPVTIFVKDAESLRYRLVNRAAEQLWGVSREQVVGKNVHEVFPKTTAEAIWARERDLLEQNTGLSEATIELETPGNGMRTVSSKIIMLRGPDGAPQHLLGVIQDVTESARASERIRYMAHHDTLTGLPNRALFMDKIEDAIARLHRYGDGFAILMLDLDRFKEVNDTLGHAAGDNLLWEAAARLKSSLRETDIVARLGGDEFAIIQRSEGDQRGEASALAERIAKVIAAPFPIIGNDVTVGVSMGISLAPDDGDNANDLLKKADLALYQAKSRGRNCHSFFDSQLAATADARHYLERELRAALAGDQIEVYFQPIVQASSRAVCAVEALARWPHPTKGFIPPGKFIPVAEETGLIVAVGETVLRKACAAAVHWPEHVKVAVNVSPLQFTKSDLLGLITRTLAESGLAPERLELEITETVLIERHMDVLPVIRQLKKLGISIVLDDFGTGYSSLSYLTLFPFDKIKIDQSFTQNLTRRAECAAIVSAIRALAYSLDIMTVAEGVESEQHFEILRAAGVNCAQGYLFGRPCPASELDFSTVRPKLKADAA